MSENAESGAAQAALSLLQQLLELFPIHPTSAEPAVVMPHLLLGSAAHGENVDMLKRLGVTRVINCAEGDVPTAHYSKLREAGIDVVGFSSSDSAAYPLMERHLDYVIDIVKASAAEGGRCLIHCQAGVNRSGALAIAALVETSGVSLVEAAKRVKRARGRVCTNQGFQRQLVQEGIRRHWQLF